MANLKMYILVRDDVPLGTAMVAVAHASLAGYLEFQETPEMAEWLSSSFRKVVCVASAKEFSNAKAVADSVVITESSMGDREVAIVFKPRAEWPRVLKFARRYDRAPNQDELITFSTGSERRSKS